MAMHGIVFIRLKTGTHEGACTCTTLLQHAPGAKLPRLHQRFLAKKYVAQQNFCSRVLLPHIKLVWYEGASFSYKSVARVCFRSKRPPVYLTLPSLTWRVSSWPSLFCNKTIIKTKTWEKKVLLGVGWALIRGWELIDFSTFSGWALVRGGLCVQCRRASHCFREKNICQSPKPLRGGCGACESIELCLWSMIFLLFCVMAQWLKANVEGFCD